VSATLDEIAAPLDASTVTSEVTMRATPPIPRPQSRVARATGNIGWAAVGVAVFALLWQLGSTRVKGLPGPGATFTTLRMLLANGFHNGGPNDQGVGLMLKASLGRVFSGFIIAGIIGIPLGLAMGSSARAWKAINPLAQFLRPVSPLAWYPILLIVFVNAAKASVWVICLTSLWPIVLTRFAYVRHVLIPHTIGSTITGLRLSMGTAWMVIVAVEMMSGKTGIGNYVWNSYNAGDMSKVTASIVLIGATGLVLDLVFLRLGRRFITKETTS
jgi:nitrate/nitrite transport system permease protein